MKYIQISAIILIILFVCFQKMRENYKVNVCIKKNYSSLSKSVPYVRCRKYGYVLPKDEPNVAPIKIQQCKIGLPSNSMRYQIYINGISRYSNLMTPHEFGPVVGEYIRFDNGKYYQLIK
jgi:hypothetical protein